MTPLPPLPQLAIQACSISRCPPPHTQNHEKTSRSVWPSVRRLSLATYKSTAAPNFYCVYCHGGHEIHLSSSVGVWEWTQGRFHCCRDSPLSGERVCPPTNQCNLLLGFLWQQRGGETGGGLRNNAAICESQFRNANDSYCETCFHMDLDFYDSANKPHIVLLQKQNSIQETSVFFY